jgi:hypothetical protein
VSLIPKPIAKALELTFAALDFLNRAWDGMRKMPRPKPVPMSHKGVAHQQAQIKAGARPFPPPRKR